MHKSLTIKRIERAVKRSMAGHGFPGFCISCGKEAEGCEPDMRNGRCGYCHASKVYGAEELALITFL